MKRLMLFMMLALLLTACNPKEGPVENQTENKVGTMTGDTDNSSEKNTEESMDTDKSTQEHELSDEEKVFAFLSSYIDTLDYPVELDDLSIIYGDITEDGQDDLVVTLSDYNATVLSRDEDTFEIIGLLDLGKTLDAVAIEDGFIVYDIGVSGTGTATNYKSIYKYDGKQVVLLEQLPMSGYDAGGDITIAGDLYFIDGYHSFGYDYKEMDVSNNLVLENSTATYVYNDETDQYDIVRQTLISEDMDGIYLSELTVGQEIDGFVVDTLESSNDSFNLLLTGNKVMKGKIGSYYNEMYDENELYFVSDTPILDQVFIQQFKDEIESDPFPFSISFSSGNHTIYNNNDNEVITRIENLLTDGQMIDVEVEVTGLYAGGIFRSEGGQSISLGNITILDPSFNLE